MMQQSAENRSAIDDTFAHEQRVYEHSTLRGDGKEPPMTETTLAGVCDTLIRNGYLITVDAKRSVYACGAVAISGNAKSIASSEGPKIQPRSVASRSITPLFEGYRNQSPFAQGCEDS